MKTIEGKGLQRAGNRYKIKLIALSDEHKNVNMAEGRAKADRFGQCRDPLILRIAPKAAGESYTNASESEL